MPPPAVKTIRDLINWEYAKLISESAGFGRKNRAFCMSKFKELQSGKIHWSTTVREWEREYEFGKKCIYCNSMDNLQKDHLISRKRNGPDIPDNLIWGCESCNISKGDKGLYEWFTKKHGKNGKYMIPRLALGKYLKLLFKIHERRGTLNKTSLIKDSKLDVDHLEVILK